ncbi:MAG: hypothetical protein ACAH80_08415 [Alphaproteobacteria bacterium]
MNAPLHSWKKKLHPHLGFALTKAFAAALLLNWGVKGYIGYQVSRQPVDPVKAEAELKSLRDDFIRAEKAQKQLNLVESTQRQLYDLDSNLTFLRINVDAPEIKVAYDEKGLAAVQEQLQQQINAAVRSAENRLVQSPHFTLEEFMKQRKELQRISSDAMYLGAPELFSDKAYKELASLRRCQLQVASQDGGAAYTADNARAVADCVKEAPTGMPLLYLGCAGLLALGIYGVTLRNKWGKAIEQETLAVRDAGYKAAAAAPIAVDTSQPLTMKPIKIKKVIAP